MNKRDLRLSIGRTLLTVSALALLAALVGVPVYLGLWQLAVYPAVIGGLIFFWIFLEHKAKTDPTDALGFLDHRHAMWFTFLFVMPSMLFLAGWTFYLALGRDPVLSTSALVIGGLILSLMIFAGPLGELCAGLFAEQRGRKRGRRRSQKGTKDARKSWLRWITPLFSPYLKLEAKLTTGETQFSATVFHFRSIILNVIVLAIRWYAGETTYAVTYLQMLWVNTSLVGWGIYLGKSASGVPIIEPSDVRAVVTFGFIGGLLVSAITAMILESLMTRGFDTQSVTMILGITGVIFAVISAVVCTGLLRDKIGWESEWITWLVWYGCFFGILFALLKLAISIPALF